MIKKTDENISLPMVVDVPYKFAAGRYLSRALTELRDNGKTVSYTHLTLPTIYSV